MDNYLNLELFRLLSATPQIANEKMESAYEKFVAQIATLNQSETDFQIVYRSLNLTRIEFVSLQSLSQYEQGKKCLRKSVFTKSDLAY